MEKNFNYNEALVRTETDENEMIWFAGIDICNILEYANSNDIIKKTLDEDERKLEYLTDMSGQRRKGWKINEFGFYSLVLSSTKPEAKVFKRWVTHEILPSIRKAGKYTSEEGINREAQIQTMIDKIDKTILDRDSLRKSANDKTKDIEQYQTELRDFLKKDLKQIEIPFTN